MRARLIVVFMTVELPAELGRIDQALLELADDIDELDPSLGERLDIVRAGVKEARTAAEQQAANPGQEPELATSRQIRFVYRNWRGEVAARRVTPVELRFAATQWHPQARWLLVAVDEDRGQRRDFALDDILAWL
jgi:predicted DNA-binding transcriptional regulator YafY